ncbi:MAG: type II toxin-antitoxin system HicA family toxin [Bacillota bacterium]|uniref:type II toxin-antitoxin system HicA family toxin n=1 Tax=Paenibacillus TaxID=44249 RepID=UPI002024AD7C|nr:type II toxin-antitoxin system HicA family toxin [Paenibacillus polymyxa]URJ45196.1 type II toxin-antitoxin system HicA family toxin [Paenibacillus polymyxa]
MKGYSSRELMKIIKADGWYYIRASGDHYQFKHPTKPGKVTIAHPSKDLPKKTIESILKQAGLL